MNTDQLNEKINEIVSKLINSEQKFNPYEHKSVYLKESLKKSQIDGLCLEFGVYRGETIQSLAPSVKNVIYGFDSFDGLHENWDTDNPQWKYSLGGKIPERDYIGNDWLPNVRLIKGYFENTLPKFLEDNKEKVSFLHIDCDLYSSTKTILTLLKDRIVPGTVICFDEIYDYNDYRDHEIKAFAEFLLYTNHNYRCIGYRNSNYSQGSFIIEK